jgi:PAS domain S-box-containing protein
LSTRGRFVLAAALATLPLVVLVCYAAVDRYEADHSRAERGASSRAQIYAALLATAEKPSEVQLQQLFELTPPIEGSALAVFSGRRQVGHAGAQQATLPPQSPKLAEALTRGSGTFEQTGSDGVSRVWSVVRVEGTPFVVAFGLPGSMVYGSARTALFRDSALAVLAALAALAAAYMLAGRVTAPIRRLASQVGPPGESDIETIRRGFDQLGVTIEESEAELTQRARRLATLNAIDKAILNADTPEEIALAAVGRLRQLVGAARASVVLFDLKRGMTSILAVSTESTSEMGTGGSFPLDERAFNLELLRTGQISIHEDLSALRNPHGTVATLLREGIRGYASVPLRAQGELFGSVNLGYHQPGGATGELLAIAREVADQLAVALRHARLHTELQAVVDSVVDGIVVVDSERRIVSANDAAARILGVSRDELIGRLTTDYVRSGADEQAWARFLETGEIEADLTLELPQGRREVEVRGAAEFLPGRHLLVIRDVTERKRLEEQLRQAQKMEAIGQLAGGIAHDFNNLLTAISGYGAVARRRIGAGPGATELAELERAAARATQLTRQLLTFSRQQVLETTLLDLNEVTGALMPMLGRLIGEDIEIAVLAADDLPFVLADRGQIEQVIINLAVNARDAMPTGGTITIETRVAQLDDSYRSRPGGSGDVEPHVCLLVTDTGVGMPKEIQEHIFEPFFTTKDPGRGTGLGLATVHGIVTQSRGRVLVYSEPGLGTTFKVYLPVVAAAPGLIDDVRDDAPEQLGGTETILLCEDEDLVRNFVEAVLTDRGYRVLSTALPRDALELAMRRHEQIDALVTDVIMPQMSGPELVERVEAARPGLRIMFLSGYTAEAVRDRGNLPLGSAFLEKPFDDLTLLRTVRALLDQTGQRQTEPAADLTL